MRKNGRITAYIDMAAIAENFENMKKNIKEGVQMVAVVKTDGYGHGAVPIAKMAEQFEYIWGFAVATFSEAMDLRNSGIQKPILILGYTFQEDYVEMAKNGIRPAIFTYEMAKDFSDAAKKAGICAPFHLAVDTGMSRIGVPWGEVGIETALKISMLSHIKMEGVFTHFSKADEIEKEFTKCQMDRFQDFCSNLSKKGETGFLRHCSNSAGILEIPEANMDLVRAGISIYGIYPSSEVSRSYVELHPAMELKSHVVYLKTIEPGTMVSYGGTFTAAHKMKIATIPVGYGDGYPRSLSGKGSVLIRGKRAPILGRICMDQFMVDVTGMDVQMLDEVTLLGRDGEEEITLEELDKLSGRFPYEFVCDIGKRVPRVYVNEKH
ncbi:MAG: alanine racemase [Lachnospiraceae bacterium]|nr:alanine racemase [Lachnospiraceae bacterium]